MINRNLYTETDDDPYYVVLTNKHVVKDHLHVKICWAVSQKCVPGQVISRMNDLDVALVEPISILFDLRLAVPILRDINGIENGWWYGCGWDRGDVIHASGYPSGNQAKGKEIVSEPIVTEGVITRQAPLISAGNVFIEHGLEGAPGSSGGPLMNNGHCIIGINTLGVTEAERLGGAVPVVPVITWLKTGEEPYSSRHNR